METIKEGQYKMPEGYIARVDKGILTIRKSKASVVNDSRCKDCTFFSKGYSSKGKWCLTEICLKKPKKDTNIFYHRYPLDKICNLFKDKNNG